MSKDSKELIKYWLDSSKHDYDTMLGLFSIKRYADSLFYGHIILEKILKALSVQQNKKQARFTHNLVILAQEAKINCSKEQMELFAEINRFNIRARYPDIKLSFYKICDRKFAENYFNIIKKLYKHLCQKLAEKK